MGEFHQDKWITTLHSLFDTFDRDSYLKHLEKRLESHAKQQKFCLLLPSLFSELENPEVLDNIIQCIQEVRYLHCVVISLGVAPEEEKYQHAKKYFGQLITKDRDVKIIWIDGPRIQQILNNIKEREIPIGQYGKG